VGSQYQGNDCIEGGYAGGAIPQDLMHQVVLMYMVGVFKM
jgi:hypothetical protein